MKPSLIRALTHQSQKMALQIASDGRIQRTERLIHQQDVRIRHQGPCKADPLLHATGQFMGIPLAQTGSATGTGHVGNVRTQHEFTGLSLDSGLAIIRHSSGLTTWNRLAGDGGESINIIAIA